MMYKSAPASRTASVKARLSVPAFLEKVAIATRRPVFAPSGVRNQRQKPMRFLAGPVTELASIIASIRRVGGSFTRVAASFVFGSSLHSIYWEGWKNDGMPPDSNRQIMFRSAASGQSHFDDRTDNMCGIVGYAGHPGKLSANLLAAMRDTIAHRGPDDSGIWSASDGSVVLGHRRLAIIDLSPTGAQPMQNSRGTSIVVFNGEIYNHEE